MSTGAGRAALPALILAVVTPGCRPVLRPPAAPGPALVRLALPPLLADDGDPATLAEAARASVAYYERLPADRTLAFGTDRIPVSELKAGMESLLTLLTREPPPDGLAAEVGRRFVAYRAQAPEGVLFTGYYLPALEARLARDTRFRFPLLGRPPDLVTTALEDFHCDCSGAPEIVGRVGAGKLVPYFTRAEIAAGAVRDAPVLAWVDDPVALFFLQVQGAGILLLPDGTRRAVGFAASNGLPYASIGKLLLDEGRLAPGEASMRGIRRWAAEHPEERDRVLNANPRYVFFRPLAGPVVGSLDVPVTPGRTIATDRAIYPPGALAFIRIPPDGGPDGTAVRPRARLVLNQDAGAAIRGAGRVDVFFGEGPEAEATAGALQVRGELFFLAPRTAFTN